MGSEDGDSTVGWHFSKHTSVACRQWICLPSVKEAPCCFAFHVRSSEGPRFMVAHVRSEASPWGLMRAGTRPHVLSPEIHCGLARSNGPHSGYPRARIVLILLKSTRDPPHSYSRDWFGPVHSEIPLLWGPKGDSWNCRDPPWRPL